MRGPEQSGHITAVGFDLYCQLLKQSVSSLKGEKVKPRIELQARLDFLADLSPVGGVGGDEEEESANSAHLPMNYVTEQRHRVEIYRKLAQATERAALEQLKKELRDRFGPLPAPAQLLLLVAELKLLAAERKVSAIETKDGKLMLTRNNDFITIGGMFPRLTKKTAEGKLREIKKLLLAI